MSKSKQDDRVAAIMQIMKTGEQSPLSVSQSFKENKPPFRRAQYYLYKKPLEERGQQGLSDRRHQGNNMKFAKETKSFVKGLLGSSHRSLRFGAGETRGSPWLPVFILMATPRLYGFSTSPVKP